ncbi:MAG: uracil phosphoribosyltransferase [Gammaproteobacteria bacterium]
MNNFNDLIEVSHPLVAHKLSLLRDQTTNKKLFKELVHELTLLIGYEATKHLPLTKQMIQTPLESYEAPLLTGKKPVILPILRAGLGMVDAMLSLMPSARVGHIGLFRDETTLQPQNYYFKIPEHSDQRSYFVCDPMLATGGSAVAALNQLKDHHISDITFICIIAAPEGIRKLRNVHPEVPIYCAHLDRGLNDKAYIVPGLGDAGDRLFGTK